jgi:hypothetical protein
MARDRTAVLVMLDLDPVPGQMHTAENVRDTVEAIMLRNFPHYTPVVVPYEPD